MKTKTTDNVRKRRQAEGAAQDPPYLRLLRLLETRIECILGKEAMNTDRIRLYWTGTHWVAFGRSAQRLCRLIPPRRTDLGRHPAIPAPVEMAALTDYKEILVPSPRPTPHGVSKRGG